MQKQFYNTKFGYFNNNNQDKKPVSWLIGISAVYDQNYLLREYLVTSETAININYFSNKK